MPKLALYHFQTLIWIARLGSYRAAADRLNTTQPAISARIKELEAQLQTELFRREGRGVALTARGRQLVTDCEPILSGLERIILETKGYSSALGNIRVGVGEIAAANCLPSFIHEVSQKFPRVTLDIELDLTSRMLENLLSGRADLVFLAGPVAAPDLRTSSIGAVQLRWVASTGTTRAEALESLPLWSVGKSSPIYHIMQRSLARSTRRDRVVNQCNNLQTIIKILQTGNGLALMPEGMIIDHLKDQTLVEIFSPPPESIEFQVCIRSSETDPVILGVFGIAEGVRLNSSKATGGNG